MMVFRECWQDEKGGGVVWPNGWKARVWRVDHGLFRSWWFEAVDPEGRTVDKRSFRSRFEAERAFRERMKELRLAEASRRADDWTGRMIAEMVNEVVVD